MRDPLQAGAIEVDKVEVEWESTLVFVVGSKDQFLAIWCECRCPVGLAEVGYLVGVAAIGIGNEQFHVYRHYEALCQQVFVFLYLRVGLGT